MIGLSILALALAQGPAALTGEVVDPDGKPLAGIEVLLSCGQTPDGRAPVIGRSRTDTAGKFRLDVPPQARLEEFQGTWGGVWAYRPGKALAGTRWSRIDEEPEPIRLTIDEPGAAVDRPEGPRRGGDRRGAGGAGAGLPAGPALWDPHAR